MSDDQQKLQDLGNLPYKQQGIWFLNAFWNQFADKEAENVWNYVNKHAELDLDKGKEGNALDELNAHRFLEAFNETLTVRDLREKLRTAKCLKEGDRPKLVPLTWFLMFKYNVDWHKLVNAPQGSKEKVAEAERRLQQVQEALEKAQADAAEAKATADASKRAEAEATARADEARAAEEEAIAREAEAKEAEAPFKAAHEELQAALAEVRAQEEAYNSRTEELKKKSEEGGAVSRNKAKNELAQHLAEDPLPLRKAKITAEAATKRAEKARLPFQQATERAEAARAEASRTAQAAQEAADEAKRRADLALQAQQAAEESLAQVQREFAEAEAYLEECRQYVGEGQMWWLDRELEEKRRFMPQSKGGIRK